MGKLFGLFGELALYFLDLFLLCFLMLKLLHYFSYLSSTSPILTSLLALSHANGLPYFAFYMHA